MGQGSPQSIDSEDELNRTFSFVVERGLDNPVGDHNCFLNTVLQTLWHVSVFRNYVLKSEVPSNTLLGIMRDTFVEYKFTDYSSISPEMLRASLTKISSEFKVGELADSIETFSVILNRIHDEHGKCTESNKCLAHRVFSGSILKGIQCKVCKTTHERIMREDFIHLVYVTELVEFASSSSSRSESFAYLLSGGFNSIMTEVNCPLNACTGTGPAAIHALLVNPPAVAISVIWPSAESDFALLSEFLSMMTIHLSSRDIFTTVNSTHDTYQFKGMICYYGKHYISIFQHFSATTPEFLLFDDARIRHIGTWIDVKEELLNSHYLPVLLLYEHVTDVGRTV